MESRYEEMLKQESTDILNETIVDEYECILESLNKKLNY